ncbi:hypothetical protein ATY75_08395 [Rhizobium sp. N122]|uniref:hypothetical protein n=1 Tax=Rhizobium sp. N122 TaxID=1764272 RepID=UPI000B5A33F5|nr:hypothetical protein [Rhizobium sp. N122]OWV74289.1 hypothetical protein ATY75_08395 [Rhizobium sp. N122]
MAIADGSFSPTSCAQRSDRLNPDKSAVMLWIDARKDFSRAGGGFHEFLSYRGRVVASGQPFYDTEICDYAKFAGKPE